NERPVRFAGVWVATTMPFRSDGSVDFDRYAEHCRWLVDQGVDGVVPNGSLGEYETLTPEERARAVDTAVAAVGAQAVVPGVSGRSATEARGWVDQAARAGVSAVMCLPPTSHAPGADEVVAHFAEVARGGLPIIAYNNPFSTRVDLVPALLARTAEEVDGVVAVKEFSQDVRRVAHLAERAPRLEVLCGCDDTFVESMLMGATGWIAGLVNALPSQSVELYRRCAAGEWDRAVALYRRMLPILRYDAQPRFVQAIKLAQDEAGRYGGPVRLPRLPLPPEEAEAVRGATRDALGAKG
ncbi:MAG TPA: dihydrodipicolinate synthase family protein, partial [Mycobacteriales bacterium]|nr:dihydrodipicolinate synthase family protein [Mycobacteriales bacterium]